MLSENSGAKLLQEMLLGRFCDTKNTLSFRNFVFRGVLCRKRF